MVMIYFSYPECLHGTYGCLANNYYCDHRYGCKECPPGTFGVNCSGICPNKHYGRLCKNECDCSSDEYCDPIKGCLQKHKGIY